MKTFVNGVLEELSSNENLKNTSIIKVLVESTKNSIALGGGLTKSYNNLRESLKEINEHLKKDVINTIISQFEKFENTNESRLTDMSKELNLIGIIENVKETTLFKDPVVMHTVSLLEDAIMTRQIPEHRCYGDFVNKLTPYSYDTVIKESINTIITYVNENQERLLVLDAIYEMSNSKLYQNEVETLTNMLLENTFTSDIIKLKTNSALPVLNELVRSLSTLEAAKSPDFSLGGGNEQCRVESSIIPATKINESTLLTYLDDKFFFISKNELVNESDNGLKNVVTVDSKLVKEKYSEFYSVCESFYKLGFESNPSGITTSNIDNFSMSFKVNESGALDIVINGETIKDPKSYDFNDILAMETTGIKHHVRNVLENTSSIFNFEFIKKITNDVSLKEAFVIEMNNSYHVCEKLNQVEREWTAGLNEYKLYRYVLENFNYDISPIFKFEINDELQKIKLIESQKEEINKNVVLLEKSISDLDLAMTSGDIDNDYISELEDIKEQLEGKIISLKERFITLDLKKKESLA